MLPTLIPDRVREAMPDARRMVFKAPASMPECGDLHTLVDRTERGTAIRSYWRLEAIEAAAMERDDRVIELSVFSTSLPPVGLAVWPAQLTVPPSAAGICWHDGHVMVDGKRMGVTALIGEPTRASLAECRHYSVDGR